MNKVYEQITLVLLERSALPRIERDDGEEDVNVGGGWSGDPDHVEDMKSRRRQLAKHLKKIRRGEAKPKQETDSTGRYEDDRRGPGGDDSLPSWDPDRKTHAQAAGDIKSDLMNSRGREAEEHRDQWEREVSNKEKMAARLRLRARKK